jgi:amino acid adenylation domain-containing protein
MKTERLSAEKIDLLGRLLNGGAEPAPDPAGDGEAPAQGLQVDGNDAFPLSFSQRRLWFLDQLEPGSAFYNFPLAVPFAVAVNVAVLQRSIDEVVRRHEALRTVFATVEGEPVQVILPELDLPIQIVDVRHLPGEAQEAEMSRLAAEMTQKPFDLARGPLLRTALLTRGPSDHVFILVMHHIISDGWSLGVFWRELVALYNAFYVNQPSPLDELPIQYADFAVWQREQLQGEKLDALVSYWTQQLEGMAVLRLPTDKPRPAVQSYRGAFQEIVLPRALTDALRTLSQREGTTLFMTLHAAFATLLQRYTGQDDIVVGSYVASRDRAELEGLIGFFINSLVLRTDLGGDPSFRELLGRVRETALDAYAHQDMPFDKLVEELQPERDLGRNPLFQVSFQLFASQIEAASLGTSGGPTIDLNRGMAIFDVAVNIWDGPEGLSGHIEYSTDLFEAATMARLCEHYRNLLQSIVAAPDTRLSELGMLSAAERHRLLVEWNRTDAEPAEARVHELFERQVARSPDAVAVISGGAELTYAALNRRANRVAHRLRGLGVAADVPVAICCERGADAVVAILAVLKAGGAYVPLDPCYPPDRLAYMLEDSGAAIVLATAASQAQAPGGANLLLVDEEAAFAGESELDPAVAGTPEDLCYLIYTSGSTGRPKGVMGPHRGTVNRLQWMWRAFPFAKGETLCQKTSLSFVDSVWELFGGLLQGVPTLLLGDAAVKDPRALVEALSAHRVTRLVLVPSLLRALLASGIDLARELPHLNYLVLSGEALPHDLYESTRQELGEARILNLYGSSEIAADALCCDLAAAGTGGRTVPIGRPIANMKAYVLDLFEKPVPVGIPGELYIAGAGLARGYRNLPDLTGRKFVADPFDDRPGARMFRTGDRVRYRDDGQLDYLGRLDDQVKVRGYRVELGEIEAILAGHPKVAEPAAAIVEVGGEPRLVAYVVPKAGDEEAAPDLEAQLALGWRGIWDETYLSAEAMDGAFNIAGWNSSYDSAAIPEAEMREWVDQTVERLLSFRPKRVLEIGCGTGLLLLRVARHCEEYVATDFSPAALDHVRGEIAKAPKQFAHVELLEREAIDAEGLGGPFDLVVINSVIQYFPSLDYLRRVLEAAIAATAPDGAVFVGDVRSEPLLSAFHTSVELHRAADRLAAEALRARVRHQLAHEKELAVAPALFHELPGVAQVTVDLKGGTALNEVVHYRYDVTLRRAKQVAAPRKWLDWSDGALTLAGLSTMLSEEKPALLGVAGVPNGRIESAMIALDLLAEGRAGTAGALRRALARRGRAGIDPEELRALGREAGYEVSTGWLGSGADGTFDVLFHRGGGFGFPSARRSDPAAGAARTTNPVATVRGQELVQELRALLQERLPEQMVPATIVLLDELPRTPNGKVDRKALPAPGSARSEVAGLYVAARTATEKRLAVIWADLLNVERVGAADNFFEIGGHSLLAMQLVSRIRVEFGKEIPVRAIFEAPTVLALAARLDDAAADGGSAAESAIERRPRGREAPPLSGQAVVP